MPSVSLIAAEYALGAHNIHVNPEPAFFFPETSSQAWAAQLSQVLMDVLLLQTGCRYLHHHLFNNLGSTKTLVQARNIPAGRGLNRDILGFLVSSHTSSQNVSWKQSLVFFFLPVYISSRRTRHRKHIDYISHASSIWVGALYTHPPSSWQPSKSVFILRFSSRRGLPGITCSISVCEELNAQEEIRLWAFRNSPHMVQLPCLETAKYTLALESAPHSTVQLQAVVLG